MGGAESDHTARGGQCAARSHLCFFSRRYALAARGA